MIIIKDKIKNILWLYRILTRIRAFTRFVLRHFRWFVYKVIFQWINDDELITENKYNTVILSLNPHVKKTHNQAHFININKPEWIILLNDHLTLTTYLSLFNNGKVIGKGAIIVTHAGKIISNSVMNFLRYFEYFRKDPFLVYKHKKDKANIVIDKAVVLGNAIGYTYYHWLIEIIPRLIFLREQIGSEFLSLRIIIPKNPPDFVLDSLKTLFNITDERIVEFNWQDGPLEVRKLFYPSYLHKIDHKHRISYYHEDVLQKLYALGSCTLSEKKVNEKKYSKAIIISRRNANKRRVVNEQELYSNLTKFGFVIKELEPMNFLEQTATFYNARIIITIHGSALANTVFCRENTVLIELYPGKRNTSYMNYFYQITGARNMHYYVLGIENYTNRDNEDVMLSPEDLAEIKKIVNYHAKLLEI